MRVLLIVIFIPSELCLTMYSLLLLLFIDDIDIEEPEFFSLLLDEELDTLGTLISELLGSVGVVGGDSSLAVFADFNLSITALSEPLRTFVP